MLELIGGEAKTITDIKKVLENQEVVYVDLFTNSAFSHFIYYRNAASLVRKET
jgi:hypothetical protein